jgi:hypothetical protein
VIPNENQSPNVTNNNNSKEFPFFSSKFGDFSRKKLGILLRIFPFSFLFFYFWKKKSPKKSYSSRNGLKQPKTIVKSPWDCWLHIIFLCVSYSHITQFSFKQIHNLPFKNGSYQSTIHSFIHSTTWPREHLG